MKGTVFHIQRMSLQDGPGIRTTVFLKGCPLRCLWCHNPESYVKKPQLMFHREKCVHCGACRDVCNLHAVSGDGHTVDCKDCTACGACAKACPYDALEICGREMTAEEVMDEVIKDTAFYEMSGGGITLSGGEPLYQPAFAAEIARLARESNISVFLETSGYAPWEAAALVAPYVDVFLYDCKETDPVLHKKFTGVENGMILENLHRLNEMQKRIVLRCPIIPGYNDRTDHFEGIARIANEHASVERIDIEPYHALGVCKREQLGMSVPADIPIPTKADCEAWADTIRQMTGKAVAVV